MYSVLVVAVLLLSVSEVISECSPSSGKTLDVYNNNYIGFIVIYLMHNGDCYPNGSYFGDGEIKLNLLECGLFGSAFNGGEWIGPNGKVPCPGSNSNLHCTNTSNGSDASLSVHINTHLEPAGDGWYKCCLPTSCSAPDTKMITANIFSKCSHCTSTHCHLLLIYCRMGTG